MPVSVNPSPGRSDDLALLTESQIAALEKAEAPYMQVGYLTWTGVFTRDDSGYLSPLWADAACSVEVAYDGDRPAAWQEAEVARRIAAALYVAITGDTDGLTPAEEPTGIEAAKLAIVACDEQGHADQTDLVVAAVNATRPYAERIHHDDPGVEQIAEALFEDAGRVANSDDAIARFILNRTYLLDA